MSYPYLPHVGPAVGGGLPGLPVRGQTGRVDLVWNIPGTYVWTVPDGFPYDSVSAAVIAGGGGAYGVGLSVCSGAAGALAYKNNIPVAPGQQIVIQVGAGGRPGFATSPVTAATAGGTSFVIDQTVCAASGGASGAASGTPVGGSVLAGDGGGRGGNGVQAGTAGSIVGAASGGASGGYSGAGGNGVAAQSNTSPVTTPGNPGAGGAGGSGAAYVNGANTGSASGSGGTGVFGEGASGLGATSATTGGSGGSGGQDGAPGLTNNVNFSGSGGLFGAGGSAGGGASASSSSPNAGQSGCVRIVAGPEVAFPSSNVGQS